MVRLPQLFSPAEVSAVHETYERLRPSLGTAGRTSGNQAAAYRQGKWETAYLSTDGAFARELPALRDRLIRAVREVDEQHWQVMHRATEAIAPRCVEYHIVEPGGSLPFIHHHGERSPTYRVCSVRSHGDVRRAHMAPLAADGGSLVTIDVMLSDTRDFEGGNFQAWAHPRSC